MSKAKDLGKDFKNPFGRRSLSGSSPSLGLQDGHGHMLHLALNDVLDTRSGCSRGTPLLLDIADGAYSPVVRVYVTDETTNCQTALNR